MNGEIFLTGATGFIGSGLLEKWLTAEPGSRINLLVRGRRGEKAEARIRKVLGEICPDADAAMLAARVRLFEGDLGFPRFALAEDEYRYLTDRTSHIIHCAAAVRFDLPLEEARAINVAGSEGVVALARSCRRLKRLDYVGTAYVAGRRKGLVTEEELDRGQEHNNTYERTKMESESLMRRAMADLPITILRPSIVICDSRTGRLSRYSAFFRVLRMYDLGYLKMLPGYPSTSMDIVPMDYVADAIHAIAHAPESPGRCYHLAAGPAMMTSLDEVVALAAEHFGRQPLTLVPPTAFDALVAERQAQMSEDEQDLVNEIRIYQPYLTSSPEFENSNTVEMTSRAGITLSPLRAYFGKMAAYVHSLN